MYRKMVSQLRKEITIRERIIQHLGPLVREEARERKPSSPRRRRKLTKEGRANIVAGQRRRRAAERRAKGGQ